MSDDAHDRQMRIVAPATGEAIELAYVPDPVFSAGTMGEGLGIRPTTGTVQVLAPVDGTVVMVAGTGHALGFSTPQGLEVLLHLGVDTVELEGKPFDLGVAAGQTVSAGQPLGTMNLDTITEAGKDTTIIFAITNTAQRLSGIDVTTGPVQAGDAIGLAMAADPSQQSEADSAPAAADEAARDAPDDGLTGFDATAHGIIKNIGGPDNVSSVIHCITRVRFYLKDQSLADDAAVADTEGVIDVAKAGGQYQVVIGPEVEDVYDAVVKQLPHIAGEGQDAPPVQLVEHPTTAWGWVKFGFSSLIGVITGSMIPIVGVLAASGILKGLLALLVQFKVVAEASDTYRFIDAMSSSMFFFLPIIVGFTAARRLGSNPIVVAIIGGVLCYPSVVTMATTDDEGYHIVAQVGRTVFNADFFGIPVALPEGNAYAYSIFPIIVAAWLATKVEPRLKKALPAVIRPIFGPLIEIFVVSASSCWCSDPSSCSSPAVLRRPSTRSWASTTRLRVCSSAASTSAWSSSVCTGPSFPSSRPSLPPTAPLTSTRSSPPQ